MSQLYVPDGNWVLCTEGKKVQTIKVTSQNKTKISGKKKQATEEDRFDGDFYCLKTQSELSSVGAGVGALSGAIAGAAIGSIGGPVGAGLGAIVGAGIGFFTGLAAGSKLIGLLPGICNSMCMLSKWSEVHPKVKIEGKKALLEKAKIQCKVGGTVYLKMYDKQEILDMVTIAKKDVYLDKEGKKGEDIPEGYRRLTETELNELGLSEELLHDNDNSGFYSQIYKDSNGDYVLAFRGSEPSPLAAGWRDFGKTNLPQGIGAYPEQYDRAAQIANILRDNGVTNVKITGHSLGGGLATYAGAITGYPTYVFNPAGVHDNTFKKGGVDRNKASHVQAFNDSNDVLNVWLQDNREVIIGGVGLGGAGLGSKFGPWGSLAGMVPAAYCYFTGALPRSSGERMEIDTGSRGIMNSVDAHNMEGNNGLIEYFESMPESNTTVKAKNK